MDNNFTMPSRTRALLYGEGYEEVVRMIADSIKKMCAMQADHIIMVCGTAHVFLPEVLALCPEAEGKMINIIEILHKNLVAANVERVLIVAAEGALKYGIYGGIPGIECITPGTEYYPRIRKFIEAVKRNEYCKNTYREYAEFLQQFGVKDVILGCTELPVLVKKCAEDDKALLHDFHFWDPLETAMTELKRIMR